MIDIDESQSDEKPGHDECAGRRSAETELPGCDSAGYRRQQFNQRIARTDASRTAGATSSQQQIADHGNVLHRADRCLAMRTGRSWHGQVECFVGWGRAAMSEFRALRAPLP